MGTHMIATKAEPDGGIKYDYSTANGASFITVHPPIRGNVQRNTPLPSGLEDVIVNIDLEETWNRPATHNYLIDHIPPFSGVR